MRGIVFSKKGEDRNVNEDYAVFKSNWYNQFVIFAVADGMGELDYGNEASKLVVDAVVSYLEDKKVDLVGNSLLLEALNHADALLEDFSMKNHCVSGVAIAIGVVANNTLTFSWQGNVRIYHGDGMDWNQLTTDHKLKVGKRGYRLTRCLKGQGLREDIPFETIVVQPGQVLMVCTDGLYETSQCVEDMVKIIKTHPTECQYSFKDDATGIFIEI